MRLGEKLYSYRKGAGLSQQELAERIGVSRQSVSKWETDVSVPSIDKLYELSKLYGVSVDNLLSEEIYVETVKTDGRKERLGEKERPGFQHFIKGFHLTGIMAAVIVAVLVTGTYLYEENSPKEDGQSVSFERIEDSGSMLINLEELSISDDGSVNDEGAILIEREP